MPATRRLAELRHPQVAELISERSIVVLPLGAVEQHGPHLPFVTDLLIADAVATETVRRFGDTFDLWLAEPLAYTKSNEHARFAGSVWLDPTTLLATVDAVARAVASTGARTLVFLTGHGGNTALLQVALREVRLAHGLRTFLLHPAVPPDAGGASDAGEAGMGVHGGLHETSFVLHLRPDLVDLGLARRNVPERLAANRHVRFGGSVPFGWLADDFGPAGPIGAQTGATPELGAALFDAAIERLGEQFTEIATFDFGRS